MCEYIHAVKGSNNTEVRWMSPWGSPPHPRISTLLPWGSHRSWFSGFLSVPFLCTHIHLCANTHILGFFFLHIWALTVLIVLWASFCYNINMSWRCLHQNIQTYHILLNGCRIFQTMHVSQFSSIFFYYQTSVGFPLVFQYRNRGCDEFPYTWIFAQTREFL